AWNKLVGSGQQTLGGIPKVSDSESEPGLSSSMQKVLNEASKEAQDFKDEYVSTEHLLLALAQIKKDPAQVLLTSVGATREAILQALTSVRGNQRVTDQNPEGKYQALDRVR